MAGGLLVIGGGAAGMSAASAARRTDPHLPVTVLEAGPHAAYGVCGLPYLVGGEVESAERLVAHPPETFRERRRIDLRLGQAAVEVDVDARTARTRDGEVLAWSRLVLAAGAAPVLPPVPGVDHPRVFAVRTLEGADRLRALVAGGTVRRAVVVGAGYVGLEMAEALCARGVETVVVEVLDHVLDGYDAPVRDLVEAEVRRHADLRLGRRVGGLAPEGEGLLVHVDGGDAPLPADVVVVATGVRPTTALLAGSAAPTGPSGALVVDDRMRTGVPGVLAAGDCAAVHHRVLGGPAFVPLGPAANKTGRVAGTVAAGGDARFPGVVGTAVVRVFDVTAASTGLGLDAARAAGLDAVATDHVASSRAKYHPDARPLHVRLVHTPQGRLLGGQVAGPDGALARIDVLATALHAGFHLRDVAELDLAYAPPYAPVYDPVIQAAEAALRSPSTRRSSDG